MSPTPALVLACMAAAVTVAAVMALGIAIDRRRPVAVFWLIVTIALALCGVVGFGAQSGVLL